MSGLEKRQATFADLEVLPEGINGEIIEGVLYTSPRPAGPHALAASALGMILGPPYQFAQGGPGGWWIVDEPQLFLGSTSTIPEIAGWRRERMPRPPQDHRFDIPPDWVCEIISPSSRRIDRVRKPPLYLHEGVKHLWLIDPLARELEVWRAQGAGWFVLGIFSEEDRVRAEPFQEVEIDLLLLWGESRPAGESSE